ncbi:MAG: DUF21 domain-containing protein [Pseudomonadota bacterium]
MLRLDSIAYPLTWFIGLLVLEGFFSGSEIALVAADRKGLQHMAAEGHKGSLLAISLLDKPNWFFSTTLLGTNLAMAANTILTTAWIIGEWEYGGEWLSALLMPPFVLILGEIVPKSA